MIHFGFWLRVMKLKGNAIESCFDERNQTAMNQSEITNTPNDSMSFIQTKKNEKEKSIGQRKMKGRRRLMQGLMFGFFRLSAAVNGIALLIIVYFLVVRGWRAITWTFLTQPPMESMTKGGILPCIMLCIGTCRRLTISSAASTFPTTA